MLFEDLPPNVRKDLFQTRPCDCGAMTWEVGNENFPKYIDLTCVMCGHTRLILEEYAFHKETRKAFHEAMNGSTFQLESDEPTGGD